MYYQAVRRVARTGSSLVISIPKEIVEKFGIRKGDYLEVTLSPRREMGIKYDDE